MRPRCPYFILAALAGSFISCSGTPDPPAKGTPAFYWTSAQESFTAGDYPKTLEHLSRIANSDNEFRQRAAPWHLVLLAGLSKANADLADQYDYGSRANQAVLGQFRKQANELRSEAARMAFDFAEGLAAFQKVNGSGDVQIAFPYPPLGSANPITTQIAEGVRPLPETATDVRAQYAQRGVLLAACRAVGNEENAAKTKETLAKVPMTVPRATFFQAAAQYLLDQSSLFSKRKLDLADRERLFKERALSALDGIPDSKDLKELKTKIQASAKKT